MKLGVARQSDQRAGERGQALVELAIVAPVLLLFVLGIVLFGRVLEAKAGIAAAAREAARVYAESPAEGPGLTLAVQRAQDVARGYHLVPGGFQVSVDGGGFVRGDEVTVQTSYAVPVFDLPLAGPVVGGPYVTVRYTHREMIELYRSRQ